MVWSWMPKSYHKNMTLPQIYLHIGHILCINGVFFILWENFQLFLCLLNYHNDFLFSIDFFFLKFPIFFLLYSLRLVMYGIRLNCRKWSVKFLLYSFVRSGCLVASKISIQSSAFRVGKAPYLGIYRKEISWNLKFKQICGLSGRVFS